MESALARVPKRRRIRNSGRNIHMSWPILLGERIEQVAALRGTTMTEIVIRVLQHADVRRLLEEWIATPAPSAEAEGRRSRNIHMYWPFPLKDRIDEVAAIRGMTKTEIVVRVLQHADARRLLEQWIVTPPPSNPAEPTAQEVIAG